MGWCPPTLCCTRALWSGLGPERSSIGVVAVRTEVAEMLGCSRQRVNRLAREDSPSLHPKPSFQTDASGPVRPAGAGPERRGGRFARDRSALITVAVVVPAIWIADLGVSDATAAKISAKHNVSRTEAREALVCVPGIRFVWDFHPERGRRALCQVRIRGEKYIAVLYPVSDPMGNVWNLGSIYREASRARRRQKEA